MRFISSRDNPKYKLWKKWLTDHRLAKSAGKALVAPGQLREEFVCLPVNIQTEIVTEGIKPRLEALAFYLNPELFQQLDVLGTKSSLFVVNTPTIIQGYPDPQSPAVFLPLQDPKNLGAAIRCAFVFGIRQIVLTQESCWPYHIAVTKASALANWRVTFYQVGGLSQLEGEFAALDLDGLDLTQNAPKTPWILLGQEGPGLRYLNPRARIHRYRIPTPESLSLNAAVALGVFLYENWQRQKNNE